VLREAGRSVPGDIALIGFDDLPLAQQTDPPLTTVRQPIAAMGKQLVGMLLDIIENGADPPRRIVFAQELMIRQSCGALAHFQSTIAK
jgi:LacI family transcriptional regulator